MVSVDHPNAPEPQKVSIALIYVHNTVHGTMYCQYRTLGGCTLARLGSFYHHNLVQVGDSHIYILIVLWYYWQCGGHG